MPDCACGASFVNHSPSWLQPEGDAGTMAGYAPLLFCPGPAAQTVGTVAAIATLYTPTVALTADQLASE